MEKIYSDNEEMSVVNHGSDINGENSALVSGMNSVRNGSESYKPKKKINWRKLNISNPYAPPFPP